MDKLKLKLIEESKDVKDFDGDINSLNKDWYSDIWEGTAFSLKIKKVLEKKTTKYQKIVFFESETFGNCLTLDGILQITERDECAYQEMIAHLPLMSHKNPKSVLIIGGGDGAVLSQVVKYKSIESIEICEIDLDVIELSKKYLPNISSDALWNDKRIKLITQDATKYIQKEENKNKYDVIICDSSDPIGPAIALFERPFYVHLKEALKKGGRACTQAESIWLDECEKTIQNIVKAARSQFDNVAYGSTQIPSYPCGQIGLLCCGLKDDEDEKNEQIPNLMKQSRDIPDEIQDTLKYYSKDMHEKAFVLPPFALKKLFGGYNGEENKKKN